MRPRTDAVAESRCARTPPDGEKTRKRNMTSNKLYDCLDERILLLDGGFGTMVQGYGLGEEEYR